ncbi:F-box only protein 34 [Rhincodon typus]|uniref:F-box only protein 34 n=1 Tax=Rhincodon typus TaxID=259920 RepID=UPI00202E0022|nr:F-box only protein 34 [Rhincodon typus]XP_048455748.1 F-box only protein 34 [Rhincodon typus]XP_048455749.1 F-box only protein 34 [Rhincodon typus]XP_048455750.1 F-box only protein 34 [Rhincodon typus]XP_048455751.1 F-box only protein 34 [Rhincodon typus]XP_048455752.1 F-box only protein 34 [Rhincodon typus]XP_048455753.1 F-box only protein 34 [Rhincodon typus]
MHLKPYPKLQKKDASLESSQETLGGLCSSQRATVRVERCQSTYNKQSCCKSIAVSTVASHISLWCPRPFGFISQNKMCNMRNPAENLAFKGRKKHVAENILPPSIHQEEGEAPLDIWAVIKPGNTKEKIAFFAAHQCNNRTGSMKIKSSWDTEVTTAKRRRKSADLEKVKNQPMRIKDNVKDVDRKCLHFDPPTTSNSEENSSVNNEKQNGDGLCHSSTLSVAEMVAFLEQRANSLLPDCSKTLTNASANISGIAYSKGGSLSSESISATGPEFDLNHKTSTENNKLQGEYVRVIEVIAKLESECMRNQHDRSGENLSRNNSFRRGVGRVLLTSQHQSEQSTKSAEPFTSSTGVSKAGNSIGENKKQYSHISRSCTNQCTESQEDATYVASPVSNTSGVVLDLSSKEFSITCKETASLPNGTREILNSNVGIPEELHKTPSLCWEVNNKFVSNFTLPGNGRDEYANDFAVDKELVSCRVNEETECKSVTRSNWEESTPCEEPLPGELFFTLEQSHVENLDSNENTTEELQDVAQCKDDFLTAERKIFDKNCLETGQGESCISFKTTCPSLTELFPLRRQVSHEFLETRFKIQQLLEPRQYMAFLPHHIMVKIFMFLPTKTLAALKCTCHYFKFIIENYDIRATDSRWVCDPRYKDDPCKQCKKHYSKGDVSPCRWHSKPYYKVLPYGRSYWMCCWQTEKDSPGCKIGLHDNNWVQSCNHIQQICEKAKKNGEGM